MLAMNLEFFPTIYTCIIYGILIDLTEKTIIIIIKLNTCLILLVLKRYFERKPLSHRSQIHQIRPSIRACIILLPFFCLNWFLGVLSLETLRTTPFELIFALTNGSHSFLAFYFHCYQRYNVSIIFHTHTHTQIQTHLQTFASTMVVILFLNLNDSLAIIFEFYLYLSLFGI